MNWMGYGNVLSSGSTRVSVSFVASLSLHYMTLPAAKEKSEQKCSHC